MKCNKKLSDIAEISVGFPFQSKLFNQKHEGFKLIRGKNVGKGFLHWGKDAMYYANVESINKNYIMRENDVVLAMDGNVVDNKSLVRKKDLPSFLVQRVARLRAKDGINQLFLWYIANTHQFEQYINGVKTGTTIQHISAKQIGDFRLDVPNLETQQKIVRILSALDQKIELNDRQNNTLFDSLREIFRNKYYRKGNDCSLSDYILTEINGDWGKDEKEENTEKAYCIRGADIPDMEYGNKGSAPSRYILEKRLEKKSLSEDDIIIEISGGSPTQSTGRTAYITQKILDMYDAPLLCTNFCKAIKVKNKVFAPFIYMYLKLLYEDGALFNWENGTTGIKNLALSSLLSNTKVQSLNDKEARRFYDQFYVIVNKISKNSAENMILIQIRDTLLPKLMSGEINLNEIK